MPQRAELYLRYALADDEVSRSLILFGTSVNEEGKVFVPSVIWRADGELENSPRRTKGLRPGNAENGRALDQQRGNPFFGEPATLRGGPRPL